MRSRPHLVLAAAAAIALGLASRKFPAFVPSLLGKYPGDALWSMVVYWGIAWLKPTLAPRHVALLALAISYADEFSQLYQAPWLNHLRATTLGHLILGSTFSCLDLLAYTAGVALATPLDRLILFGSPSPPRR